VQGKTVTCLRRDTDRYGRMVAVCTLGSIQINRWLVQQGHALPYLAYGGRSYQDAERQAKATRKGLHAGVFQAPWDYRKNPASPPTAGTPRAAPAVSPGRVAYVNCAAARAAGAAPVRVGQPGYGRHLDRDGVIWSVTGKDVFLMAPFCYRHVNI
jgi:hypothetical protein